MRKRILSMTLVLSLIFTLFMGSTQVFAATADDISITALVSDSAKTQKFQLSNVTDQEISLDWKTEFTTGWNSLKIPANDSKVITCDDPNMKGLTLTVYCGDDLKTQRSLNMYTVNVYYRDQNGTILEQTTRTSSLSGGVSNTAPSSLTKNGETYTLTGSAYKEYTYQSGVTEISYTYQLQVKEPYSCPVVYVDQNGNQIGSASFKVQPNQTGSFTPPASITGTNGRSYTLISGQKAVSHAYALGAKEYVFNYQIVREESKNPYLIRVQYQTTDGALLSSNNITVQSGNTVTFNTAAKYTSADGVEYTRAPGELATIRHTYGDNSRQYVVKFAQTAANAPYTITVRYINALTGEQIASNSVQVGLNATARFQVQNSVPAGGKTYILAAGQPNEITHNFNNAQRVYNVYYNEQGAGIVDEYPVSVSYYNVTDGTIIYSTTLTATLNNALTINVPSAYAAGGNNYVLLSGQPNTVNHEFYSVRHGYVFFYRNVNDTANEGATVETTPGGEVVMTTPEGEEVVVTPGGEVTIPEPEVPLASQPSSSSSETSSGATTIDDPDVPLAPGPDANSSNFMIWWIAGGIVLLAAAGTVVFLVIKKKKSEKNEMI